MKATATFAVSMALLLWNRALGNEAPRTETFDSAGVSIVYLVAGQGEPVVLIHGLNSNAAINWNCRGPSSAWPRAIR